MKATEFRQSHQVLREIPILRAARAEAGNNSWSITDVVDLNDNGQMDMAPMTVSWGDRRLRGIVDRTQTKEPVLRTTDGGPATATDRILQAASRTGSQMVFSNDLSRIPLTFESRSYTVSEGGRAQRAHQTQTPLNEWVQEFAARMPEAGGLRAAFDCSQPDQPKLLLYKAD
ncbi:MAG TPA: hypothetical protein VGO93_14990 [Candidatus Xenobia bacterium]|jgi:hypothetical protein